jgi:hypothetical protein
LLNAVNEQIDLIVVKDPLFLGANSKQGVRVVRLFNDDKQKSKSNTAFETLNTPMNGSTKAFVETSKKFEEELKGIKERLEKIAESRNLSEPFDRLKAACEQVQLQRTNE